MNPIVESIEYKERGFTFGNAPKLTTLKQYGFFNGIPPGFSPAERFFRQRPVVTGVTRSADRLCRVLYLTLPVL
ncbi:hypothetical protein SpAn4DRAFT_1737 [Sporomusa ovata]|uniref:Uncharacterized protein n=1 Tax=Sporomusa ovata TaxID=2378 RepID=A0A0U1KUH5_9FIRM|nr:hypothetical protein SpAn4DRAFT_1737 [Sporomusa ovata]